MEHLLIPLVPVSDKFSQGQVPSGTNGKLHCVLSSLICETKVLGLTSWRVRKFSSFFLPELLVYPKKEKKGGGYITLKWKDRRHIEYHRWSKLGKIRVDICYLSLGVKLLEQCWDVCEQVRYLTWVIRFFRKHVLSAFHVSNTRLAISKIKILITKGKE